MNKYLTSLIFVFLCLIAIANVEATDYYINCTTGNNANTGLSPSQAWNGTSKLHNMVFNGSDNVYLKGNCNNPTEIDILTNLSSSGTLTITSYGGGANLSAYSVSYATVPNALWTNISATEGGMMVWNTTYSSLATSNPMIQLANGTVLISFQCYNTSLGSCTDTSDQTDYKSWFKEANNSQYASFSNNTNNQIRIVLPMNENPNSVPIFISGYSDSDYFRVKNNNGSVKIRIHNLTFSKTKYAIVVYNSSDATIENNTFDEGLSSIYFRQNNLASASRNVTIRNNLFIGRNYGLYWGKWLKGTYHDADAIAMEENGGAPNYPVYIYNNYLNGTVGGIRTEVSYASKMCGSLISNNTFDTTIYGGWGSRLEKEEYGCNTTWSYNKILGGSVGASMGGLNSSTGTSIFKHNIVALQNTYIFNSTTSYGTNAIKVYNPSYSNTNVVKINITNNLFIGSERAWYSGADTEATNLPESFYLTVKDNIFISNTSGTGVLRKTGTPSNNNYWNYNDYYTYNGAYFSSYWSNDTKSTVYSTLASAKAGGSWNGLWDTGSVQLNPLINMSNFVPASNSPICNISSNGSYIGPLPCYPPDFVDTGIPYFINITNNITVTNANASLEIQFQANDDGVITNYTVNNSLFNMSSSGLLSRFGTLPEGTYDLNLTVYDSAGHNSSIIYQIISSSDSIVIFSPTFEQNIIRYLNMSWSGTSNIDRYKIDLLNNDSTLNYTIAETINYVNNTEIIKVYGGVLDLFKDYNFTYAKYIDSVTFSVAQTLACGYYAYGWAIFYYEDGTNNVSTTTSAECGGVTVTKNNPYPNKALNRISVVGYGLEMRVETFQFTAYVRGNNITNYDTRPLYLDTKQYYISVSGYNTLNNLIDSDAKIFNLTSNALLYINATSYLGIPLNNFNITLLDLNSSINISTSTTNGRISLNSVYLHDYSLIVNSSSLTRVVYNFTANRTTYITATSLPPNAINVSSFLESTGLSLNVNASLEFIGTLSSFITYLNGTSVLVPSILADTYSIKVTSTGYASRTYVATVTDGISASLNIYMLPINSSSIIGIYTKDLSDNILASTTIQVQQLVNTSYLGITQGVTDGNGFITFSLEEGKTYRLIISANNFDIFQIGFVPYLANSPYTFKLSPSSSFVYTTLNDLMSYSYSPTNTNLNSSNNTFSLSTFSATGLMRYTFINCSGYTSNSSGSPTGSTVSVTLNVNEGQSVLCLYSFDVIGYGYYSFRVTYLRLDEDASSLKRSATVIKNTTSEVWLTLLAFVLMTLVAIGIKQRYPDTRITGVIFTVGTIFFVAIGWINWVAGGVSATIGLLLLYVGSR